MNLELIFQSLQTEELLAKMLRKPENEKRSDLIREAIESERIFRESLRHEKNN